MSRSRQIDPKVSTPDQVRLESKPLSSEEKVNISASVIRGAQQGLGEALGDILGDLGKEAMERR